MSTACDHHCGYCGKAVPTIGGVKRHIARHPECCKCWEAMVAQADGVSVFDEPEIKQDQFDGDEQDDILTDHQPGPPPDGMEDWQPPTHTHTCSPASDTSEVPKCPRATVEDVADEDEGGSGRFFKNFDGAGKTERAAKNEPTYFLFEDNDEWDLTAWMMKHLGQTRIDEFLKLLITCNLTTLSFHNAHSFLKKVDVMPCGPSWGCKKVKVTGNQEGEDGEILMEEVKVWQRDIVECVSELVGNLLFKEHMAYAPVHAFKDKAGLHRLINDMWTAD
ncbi:hypothetical protein PAXRUDRAFT_15863 [Paxillus rubicundulus Ve08.2h10]|uniref:C2H2-type domain-containing protein n=1 Tax=Paxillus rubicundulus Ve08.2h10 TaxID=930991 RepID=A0A0D0DGB8_9AGAM|nr:hypothetical protein PAXRUDRAFT_15863 [Paxillus rubicundulus Ve08.2h10]